MENCGGDRYVPEATDPGPRSNQGCGTWTQLGEKEHWSNKDVDHSTNITEVSPEEDGSKTTYGHELKLDRKPRSRSKREKWER